MYALAVSGSSLFIGGSFAGYRATVAGPNLVKVDLASGALDKTFTVDASSGTPGDGSVNALAVSGPSLFLGGSFAGWRGGDTFTFLNGLAKVSATNGALDATFHPEGGDPSKAGFGELAGPIGARALSVSGTAVHVAGFFTQWRGTPANSLARLDATTGALDTTFSPGKNGFDSEVRTVAPVGSALVVGGSFGRYRDENVPLGLAKLDATSGARDGTFGPPGGTAFAFDGPVSLVASNGSTLLVGGSFGWYGGTKWVGRIARLDPATGALR